MSVKFGDSSLPWESSSDIQFGLPPQAEGTAAAPPATPFIAPVPTAPAADVTSGQASLDAAQSPAASPTAASEFPSFASFGGSSFAAEQDKPIAAAAAPAAEPRYVESPLFDEFDSGDDSEELIFGGGGRVLESPLPGELSEPLSLPAFVEQFLNAEMEDDEQFEDFNEEDFDEEFDDDFEEEEDDFDYGEQELEDDVDESEDAGGDLGPDAVPDADFED